MVSPADGLVQAIAPRRPPPELELGDAPLTCISVFLNVLDVHVNRAPVGGRIARLAYHPGKFLNAADDKASEDNERQSFRIETDDGQVVGLVQIAGLIARRIVAVRRAGRGGPCGRAGRPDPLRQPLRRLSARRRGAARCWSASGRSPARPCWPTAGTIRRPAGGGVADAGKTQAPAVARPSL